MPHSPEPHSTAPSTREQWLAWGRGKWTNFPAHASLPEIFGEWAKARDKEAAVLDGARTLTYGELNVWSDELAQHLRKAGVERGGIVGLPAVRSADFVAGILGVLKAGCAYLPLDEDEPESRRALRRSDCDFVLQWPAGDFASEGTRLPKVEFGGMADVPRLPTSQDAGGAAAYVLYTSGSTGKPKGVVVPHRAIARLVCATDYLDLQASDRFALHSNLSFDASTLEIWGPLLNGGSLVVTPRETVLSATALTEHLRDFGINSLWLTTTLFAQLAGAAPAMFAGLRHLLFGGEAAQPGAIRRVWEAGAPEFLINGYGPTETTTFAVCHRIQGGEDDRIPIGRPIANTDAFIFDETGALAREGELCLGGPGVAIGYLREPILTAERFVDTEFGRVYRTGDRVCWREDGTLDFLGRTDRQVKIRGFRIELGEVESAILRHSGVLQAAVVAGAAAEGEQRLAVYYVGAPTPAELRAFLQRELPEQMVPVHYLALSALPLTPNGKLDEKALPEAILVRSPEGSALPPSATALQREIAAAWSKVLGLQQIGLDDNFFDLGGTSLSALRLHAELLGRPLASTLRIVAIFEHPTVRALAGFLEGTNSRGAASGSQAMERAARRRAALRR